MIDCHEVMKRLWEYLDGELPAADVDEVRAHLAECGRCYPQYQFQLAFLAALMRAGRAPGGPRPEFVKRLKVTLASAPPAVS